MKELIFVLSHYFAVGVIALLAYVFGRRLTFVVRYDSLAEELSFSITLGLGLIAYLVFVLGLCGLLNPALLASLLLIGALICNRVWSGWFKRLRRAQSVLKRSNKGRMLLSAVAVSIVLLPLMLLPLYPPTAWDATEYHLASAKSYVQNRQIVLTPYLRFPVFPQNNQMLFTLALLFYDDILAQLIEFMMMAVLVLSTIAFGRRFFSARAGIWAAAILLESPLVIWLGSVAYVDMALMLFVMMTVYALWNFFESEQQEWLMLAGVFCGLAVGTKYPALFFLLVLMMITSYIGIQHRRILTSLRPVALATVIFAPWLLRNFYYTKNPLFPFFYESFGRVFGYGLWKAEDFKGIFDDYSRSGVGRNLKELLLLPWNLVVHWRSFGAFVSPIYFFVPHLLFIAGVARKRSGGLLIIAVGFTLFWFFTSQEPRYVMPVVPLLSLAAAASLDALLFRFFSSRAWASGTIATMLAAIILISPGWVWSLLRLRERGPVPVSAPQRDDYLTRQLPSYPAYKLLNELKGRNYMLYALADERMAYFADGLFMGDHFGPARYSRILANISDSQSLYNELRALGADYFLFRNDLAQVDLPHDKVFQSKFNLVYEQAGVRLFQLNIGDP